MIDIESGQVRDMKLEQGEFLKVVQAAPLVSIDVIARDRLNRVLLGKRINEPAKGTFFTPGGRIRKNQTILEAILALGESELGLRLSPASAKLLGAYDHIYASNFAGVEGIGTHYVVLGYEFTLDEIELGALPLDQHSQWIMLHEAELLARDDVHENVKKFFSKTRSGLKRRP